MGRKIIIISLFIFLMFNPKVLAFDKNYEYNYEVKSLRKNQDGTITVSGWAILNAGVEDASNYRASNCKSGYSSCSPHLNKDLGSGSKSTCSTNNANNYYTYTLYVAPLDNNKRVISSAAIEVGSQRGNSSTSLTNLMCYKNSSGSCVASRSSCYENVGFNFSFNESLIQSDIFSNGYVLRLKIKASGNGTERTFPLVVYSERISGFGNNYEYRNNSGLFDNLRVSVIVFDGFHRTCSGGVCQRKNDGLKFPNPGRSGSTLNVQGITSNRNENNLTYYKVGSGLYIPASWVAPPDTDLLILPPPPSQETVEVKDCNDTTVSQTPISKEIQACSGEASFEGSNYASCSVDEFEYYTKKCQDTNFKANLQVNNLNSENSFTLTNGSGFEVKANLKTNFSCSYTFNTEKFKENYDNVLRNLERVENESAEWYLNYNVKENLDRILENYLRQTNYNNGWNSGYNFDKLTAVLKVEGQDISLVYNQDDIDSDGKVKSLDNTCQVASRTNLNINNHNYQVSTNITCKENYDVTLQLPKVCLNMKTGNIEDCIPDANNQIVGGNKHYLNMNSLSGEIQVVLKNLGYDGNFDVTLKNCNYNVPQELNKQIIFRAISLTDPFLIKKYDRNRGVGNNYLNSNYDFQKIIKEDIWSQVFEYRYLMSRINVNNIKRDTNESFANSYLGKNCYFSAENKYICEFTRNINQEEAVEQNKLFTKVEIN